MNEPLSQVAVEAEIVRISGLLDRQVTKVAQRARFAAEAEVAYKIGYAEATLKVEGATVAERDAKALLECRREYAEHKGADAVLLAAQEAGRSYRAQLDALRSIAANLRSAITYASGVGS